MDYNQAEKLIREVEGTNNLLKGIERLLSEILTELRKNEE